MRMVMLMADQHALARAAHAMLVVVLLQPLQARKHARVLLGLRLLGAERVVGQRVQADRGRLLAGEVFGGDGSVLRQRW